MFKILIVDDEKEARDCLADLLTDLLLEPEITKVCNSREVMELMEIYSYDILMTGINMPGMDGLSMIEEIVNRGKYPYIVIVSAFNKFEYAQKAIELGANAYILKPLQKDLIHNVLRRYREFLKKFYQTKVIALDKSNGSFLVRISDILAVEIQEKNFLKVYKSDSVFSNIRGQLCDVASRLPDYFIRINRQCIANSFQIRSFNSLSREITMLQNGKELVFQVSRECNKKIRKLFKSV
ncbi:MAG: response regulator [Tannerella sp.]|jgi:YesN/AraC family two-component response regulator|nr:response regulator [Tannerella sp.]